MPLSTFNRRRNIGQHAICATLTMFIFITLWQAYQLKQQAHNYIPATFWQELIRKSPAAVIAIDGDTGNIIDWNLSAERFFGWSYSEAVQLNINHLVVNYDKSEFPRLFPAPVFQQPLSSAPVNYKGYFNSKRGKPVYVRGMLYRSATEPTRLISVSVPEIRGRMSAPQPAAVAAPPGPAP